MDNDKIVETLMNINTAVARIEGKIDSTNNYYESLEKRVEKVENTITWITRTILALIISAVIKLIIDIG